MLRTELTPLPPAAWYHDPSVPPALRWWDGARWTGYCASSSVVVVAGPNHGLHLCLTVLTCGWWLPVWLLVALASPRRVVMVTMDVYWQPAWR